MPIYEYQCESCGHKMEKIQKMSDEPLKVCPSCEQSALKKLVSAAAFRLKGEGWYETDFKTGSKKNALHRSDNSNSDSKSPSSKNSVDKKTSGKESKSGTDTKSSATPSKSTKDSSK
ncbi:MAG: putative FmdB family regulatory protein [Candidatus Azotimanducaceae bacterium]|jgi:putative FmdB family regulatory protein